METKTSLPVLAAGAREPRFLVLGERGWIGAQMVRILQKKHIQTVFLEPGARPEQGAAQFEAALRELGVTHVVSLIGRTHGTTASGRSFATIDYLEQPGKLAENVRDNLYAPLLVAAVCSRLGVHLTYLGTGCIFEYDAEHRLGDVSCGFGEADVPNFLGSSYSVVKGATDQLMQLLFGKHVLNLRIRMPITSESHPRNFVTKILGYAKICSVPNSMSNLDELLPLAVDLALRKTVGTLNFTNPGVISHNEVLEMYRSIVDPAFEWENFSEAEQAQVLAAGRSNNCLDTQRLRQLCPAVQDIGTSVRAALLRYAETKKKGESARE